MFRDFLMVIVVITMFFAGGMIPSYLVVRGLGLLDTFWALILPTAISTYNMIIMRTGFATVPDSLEESARIDGCNIFQMFCKVVLPLAVPVIATLAIFTFVSTWNSFMWPLIVTNTESMRTLPVGLAIFKGSFRDTIEWGQLLACSVLALIPVFAVFFAGKKYCYSPCNLRF